MYRSNSQPVLWSCALHLFIASRVASVNENSISLVFFLLFIGSIVCILFGFFFIAKSQLNGLSQKIIKNIIVLLFVVVTSSLGNVLQNGALIMIGSSISGMFVGGAIGGAVVWIGMFICDNMEHIPLAVQRLLGFFFCGFGLFICLVTLFAILAGSRGLP